MLTCGVQTLLDVLPPSERELLDAALADPRIRKSELARRLRAAGHAVSAWTLRSHARKDCSCPSKTT